MADPNPGVASQIRKGITDQEEFSAVANAEAKEKAVIWADKIDSGDIVELEACMENYEVWNAKFINELVKRECQDTIKYALDIEDKISMVANKNVRLFLKRCMEPSLLQMVECESAYETYMELTQMAPDRDAIQRALLEEVKEVRSHDIKAYVLSHQDIHSSLLKDDAQSTTEASTKKARMSRLLDRLNTEQKKNNKLYF